MSNQCVLSLTKTQFLHQSRSLHESVMMYTSGSCPTKISWAITQTLIALQVINLIMMIIVSKRDGKHLNQLCQLPAQTTHTWACANNNAPQCQKKNNSLYRPGRAGPPQSKGSCQLNYPDEETSISLPGVECAFKVFS